jgi:putative membrane protein
MKKLAWLCSGLFVAGASILIAEQVQDRPQLDPAVRQQIATRFLTEVYGRNLFDIATAQLVADKAMDPEVKKFVQSMMEDHKQLNEKVKAVAEKLNIELPTQIEEWQKSFLTDFGKTPSGLVERAYMFHLVGRQVSGIYWSKCAANHAQNPEIQQLAQNLTTKFQQRLQQASQIADQLAGGPPIRILGTPVSDREPQPGQSQDK